MKQRNQTVTKRAYSIFALVVLLPSSAVFEKTPKLPRVPIPPQVTVCQILRAPYQFDGKIVQVRGYIVDSDEYSLLAEEGCHEDGIWFRFADGPGLPGLKILTLPAHPDYAKATKTGSEPRSVNRPPAPNNIASPSPAPAISSTTAANPRSAPQNQFPRYPPLKDPPPHTGKRNARTPAPPLPHTPAQSASLPRPSSSQSAPAAPLASLADKSPGPARVSPPSAFRNTARKA